MKNKSIHLLTRTLGGSAIALALFAFSPAKAQDGPPSPPDGSLPPPPPGAPPFPPGFQPPPGMPMPQGIQIRGAMQFPPDGDHRQVDVHAAGAALKLVSAAVESLVPGQVWVRPAPNGGPSQVEASILLENREVARLEFNAADSSVLPRGYHAGPPRPGPRPQGAGPLNGPPPHPGNPNRPPPPSDGGPGQGPPPPPEGRPTPAPNLETVKAKLADIIKGLKVGNGAEVEDHQWRVPLIYEDRIVGDVQVSGDGKKIMQNLEIARDAAMFAP